MARIYLIVGLGLVLLVLATFQVLVGRRVVRFDPKHHFQIHKWTGYVLLAIAYVHAIIALGWIFGWY